MLCYNHELVLFLKRHLLFREKGHRKARKEVGWMVNRRDWRWEKRFGGKYTPNAAIPHLKDLDTELWQKKTQGKTGLCSVRANCGKLWVYVWEAEIECGSGDLPWDFWGTKSGKSFSAEPVIQPIHICIQMVTSYTAPLNLQCLFQCKKRNDLAYVHNRELPWWETRITKHYMCKSWPMESFAFFVIQHEWRPFISENTQRFFPPRMWSFWSVDITEKWSEPLTVFSAFLKLV